MLASMSISWFAAQIWLMGSRRPLCLDYVPDWADHIIANVVGNAMSTDMVLAAEKIDFVETYISCVIVSSLLFALMTKLFLNKLLSE